MNVNYLLAQANIDFFINENCAKSKKRVVSCLFEY